MGDAKGDGNHGGQDGGLQMSTPGLRRVSAAANLIRKIAGPRVYGDTAAAVLTPPSMSTTAGSSMQVEDTSLASMTKDAGTTLMARVSASAPAATSLMTMASACTPPRVLLAPTSFSLSSSSPPMPTPFSPSPNAFPMGQCKSILHPDKDDGCITPQKRVSPLCGLTCTPEVPNHFLPYVGMEFANVDSAEKFYKEYAHEAGFSVRIGQRTTMNREVTWKRFYCSREGFRGKGKKNLEATDKNTGNNKKRKYVRKLSRCGCEAMTAIKRTPENKYKVEIFQPVHAHILVSPSKRHLLPSNRQVSEKAKIALFDCHKASIGTSLPYRYLRVNEGGFENVGCTKKDLQNYHGSLRALIKTHDAQMFVDNLAKKNSINSGFYFDYVVDEEGKLVHVFWADTTSRKNYIHFGELLSFDSTYSTNEYNMKFTPFTGLNHHGGIVLLGAALISDEIIESYVSLFRTFLKAMGGNAPKLIITDEDASMHAAIAKVFPTSTHRFCMWHILMKLPDKVGPSVRENKDFYNRVNRCVYSSETKEEFESEWAKIIEEFGLEGNEWLRKKYEIRASWIPAYFRDIFLAGILRTTSRSESANSFFKCFIGFKQTLVEFWVRFDTAVEEQREKDLMDDNSSLHTDPILLTKWSIEKHGSEVLTYNIFVQFQKEVLAARDHCMVDSMKQDGSFKIYSITDDSPKVRDVNLDISTMIGHCSCMLFQTHGIPCRHIIYVLRGAKLNELPSHYILKRWTKNCKREIVYEADGNLLEEKRKNTLDTEFKRMASDMHKEMEDIFQQAGGSMDTMNIVTSKFQKFIDEVKHDIPANQQSRVEEIESFIGCTIPSQINIFPPNELHSRGRVKRIKALRQGWWGYYEARG
ncbi:hypothetical protein ACP4OV_020617 [Aristida adscensionis]